MKIEEALKERILVLDGAMGTAIQQYGLTADDFDGKLGCNEVLNRTRPDIIEEIHRQYIEAGADIIETNSFNCNAISLGEYGLGEESYALAKESVRLAKKARLGCNKDVYIAGSIGPTSKSLSVPMGNVAYDRAIDFASLCDVYRKQIEGLLDGGVDLLLIETIFDGLNAKAAVWTAEEVMAQRGRRVPISISMTVDQKGRLFTGQDAEALVVALDRDSIISYGFNCSFGAKDLIPLAKRLGKFTKKAISLYPNAGLPNEEGEYDETPEVTASFLQSLVAEKAINILGGCCGTHKGHIAAISSLVKGKEPRLFELVSGFPGVFSGLSIYDSRHQFTLVGERNNVAGSKRFRTWIQNQEYDQAVEAARQQMEDGAAVLDINMDDGLLDSPLEMARYLKVLQNDRKVAQVPLMIDSSDFTVLETGLCHSAGKSIVNSLSLKEGEALFREKASIIKKYGAALVIMAFDEQGQATTYDRTIAICQRSYDIVKELGFSEEDILFDLNILAIGTGQEEDRYHSQRFLQACTWIRTHLGSVGIIGGVSNLSFAFRGNAVLRAGIHDQFLTEARKRGLNFAIRNPSEKAPVLDEREQRGIQQLLEGEEGAVDTILTLFQHKKTEPKREKKEVTTPLERVKKALLLGSSSTLQEDMTALLQDYEPMAIIQDILMVQMEEIGLLFERGELYLPQLIRSASVMKQCVDWITPHLGTTVHKGTKGTVVVATVAGDVHDIGKNIVATVLRCNGYEVIDLGVMVEAERIEEVAVAKGADVVALSGLISPSLKEMEKVLSLFAKNNHTIPVLIAGATTSPLHTAVKLAPVYPHYTLQVAEAIDTLTTVHALCSEEKESFLTKKEKELTRLRTLYEENGRKEKKQRPITLGPVTVPKKEGTFFMDMPISTVKKHINWSMVFHALAVKGTAGEEEIRRDSKVILDRLEQEGVTIKASYALFPCTKKDDCLYIQDTCLSLGPVTQFFHEKDYIGLFALSVHSQYYRDDEYNNLLEQLLLTRLVEAAAEELQQEVSRSYWPVAIRPAIGYPTLPDHSLKQEVLTLLDKEKLGITLTDTFAMEPLSSVCGLYIGNPHSFYLE